MAQIECVRCYGYAYGLNDFCAVIDHLRPMDLDIKDVVNPEAKQVVMRTLFSQTPHGLRQQGIKTWRSFLLFYVTLWIQL